MRQTSLDLDRFEEYLQEAVKIVADHIQNIAESPVIPEISPKELYAKIPHTLPMEGVGIEQTLAEFRETIVPYSTRIGHPRFLAWIVTSPAPAGTIGEILNIGLNQVPLAFKGSPSASITEDIVLQWFGQLFGYPQGHGGVLVSGGTMANLTALTVAREVHAPGAMQTGLQQVEKPLVIYVSDQGHMSVERSAGMLGIGAQWVRKIPTDANFRMRLDALEAQVIEDREAGYQPFCVVAQVGAVNTGAIDPLMKIADFCSIEGLWFHVDAAYGGGAILAENGREWLKGIERADSIATDPHKWFFIPVEAGCTLIRNREQMYNTFKAKAGYLGEEVVTDYMNYGFQLTRASRALKIWFAFRSYGLARIGEIIEGNIALAKECAAKLARKPHWEVLAPVELSIVCFRYIPKTPLTASELNALQYQILDQLERSGIAFLTPAVLRGHVCLRICFANHRTTSEDLDLLLQAIETIAEEEQATVVG